MKFPLPIRSFRPVLTWIDENPDHAFLPIRRGFA
jgi:hypothetical protein